MASFYLDPETGKRFYLRRPFTHGGINYTKAGATVATFLDLGFQAVTIQARPSDKYYIVSGVADDGSYQATPRDLDECKESCKSEQKRTANTLLAPTDWMVVRGIENPGKPVDTAISTYRSAVRDASTTREAEIDAATTIEELEAAMQALTEWPEA
ncbi:tail fiber assembly protein [Synechococcus phage S-CRES3]|nr:tail fiber assembly protein [Synechococcus phage S-CRES3]